MARHRLALVNQDLTPMQDQGAAGGLGPARKRQEVRATAPIITRQVIEKMKLQALEEYPLECCGLLYGDGERLDRIYPALNSRRSRSEFAVAPGELLEFFRGWREEGMSLLGIYHSHPDAEAFPSRRDRDQFYYPEASYWIVSVWAREASIRCFLWRENDFEEVEFRTVE